MKISDVEYTIKEIFLAHILTDDLTIYTRENPDDIFIYYKNIRICRININEKPSENCIIFYSNIKNKPTDDPMVICKTEDELLKHLNFINDNIEKFRQTRKEELKTVRGKMTSRKY